MTVSRLNTFPIIVVAPSMLDQCPLPPGLLNLRKDVRMESVLILVTTLSAEISEESRRKAARLMLTMIATPRIATPNMTRIMT